MWHPDDVDDVYADIRLAFGQRYARHLREAAGHVLRSPADFARLGAAWVQHALRRGSLWRDVDGDAVLLRLPIGPWTFDFAFTASDDRAVVAGHPDTLFRDTVPVTVDDFAPEERARFARASGQRVAAAPDRSPQGVVPSVRSPGAR